MTINLETEIVATRFDFEANVCHYTIRRGTKNWTVPISIADLDRHGVNKAARRNHLANALETAISQRDPDPEVPAANPPANPQ